MASGKRFSDEETRRIIEAYPRVTPTQLASEMGRTTGVLFQKIAQLRKQGRIRGWCIKPRINVALKGWPRTAAKPIDKLRLQKRRSEIRRQHSEKFPLPTPAPDPEPTGDTPMSEAIPNDLQIQKREAVVLHLNHHPENHGDETVSCGDLKIKTTLSLSEMADLISTHQEVDAYTYLQNCYFATDLDDRDTFEIKCAQMSEIVLPNVDVAKVTIWPSEHANTSDAWEFEAVKLKKIHGKLLSKPGRVELTMTIVGIQPSGPDGIAFVWNCPKQTLPFEIVATAPELPLPDQANEHEQGTGIDDD